MPGPVTIEQMYNIFPFDNSITKMQLSGAEVQRALRLRRAPLRGPRLRLAGADRRRARPPQLHRVRSTRADRGVHASTRTAPPSRRSARCDTSRTLPDGEHPCAYAACAEHVYIGSTSVVCNSDADCVDTAGNPLPSACGEAEQRTARTLHDARRSSRTSTSSRRATTSRAAAPASASSSATRRSSTRRSSSATRCIDYIRQGKPCGWQIRRR